MTHQALIGRRAELMVELFLQELNPASIARPPADFGYDLLVGFPNREWGINYFGIEVKATERPVSSWFAVSRRTYDLLAHSSLRGLLIVADVKQNRLYFGWPPRVDTRSAGSGSVKFPLTQIDPNTRKELHTRFTA